MQDENGIVEVQETVNPRRRKVVLVTFFVCTVLFYPLISFYSVLRYSVTGVLCAVCVYLLIDWVSPFLGKKGRKYFSVRFKIVETIYILLVSVLAVVWTFDAAPIEGDYTIADLRSAPVEYNESYEVLMRLAGDDDSGSELPADFDYEALMEIVKSTECRGDSLEEISVFVVDNANEIIQLWESSQADRAVINELYGFDEIADLSVPNIDTEYYHGGRWRKLLGIYDDFLYLQIHSGDERYAVEELIKIDSVIRRLNLNHRSLITKLSCNRAIRQNMMVANYAFNSPRVSEESLKLLVEHFVPLEPEQLSMRNAIIAEYLIFQNSSKSFQGGFERPYPLSKPNSSSRLYRNVCSDLFFSADELEALDEAEFSVWPRCLSFMPEVVYGNRKLPWYYLAYNPIDSMMLMLSFPVYENTCIYRSDSLRVRNDLLQVVISKRLGRGYSLAASAYSDEYVVDVEKGMIFSCGADGVDYTKDDIKLYIRPEVLGFSN